MENIFDPKKAPYISFKELSQVLKSDVDNGLTKTQVNQLLEKFGKNILPQNTKTSALAIF